MSAATEKLDDATAAGSADDQGLATSADSICQSNTRHILVGNELHGSRDYWKAFMTRHGIPTAEYKVFTDYYLAQEHIEDVGEVFIKAAGLAARSGVVLPEHIIHAWCVLADMIQKDLYRSAGHKVVIEEVLYGEEISVLVINDGETLHTEFFLEDAPVASATSDTTKQEVQEKIIGPTLKGIRREGMPFMSFIFIDIMLTSDGPMALEFNVCLEERERMGLGEIRLENRSECLRTLVEALK